MSMIASSVSPLCARGPRSWAGRAGQERLDTATFYQEDQYASEWLRGRSKDIQRYDSWRLVAGLSRLILHVEPAKLLHALAGIDLGGKEIALSIDGDIVERRELADLPPRPTEAA